MVKEGPDPFARKDLYTVKAPSFFCEELWYHITRTTGTKIASEGLKGRVFELSLADLNGGDESQATKIRLIAEDVQGNDVLTNFHGMDMTRDKLCSLIRKWQTLIEAYIDIRTTDGYYLVFLQLLLPRSNKTKAQSLHVTPSPVKFVTLEKNIRDYQGRGIQV